MIPELSMSLSQGGVKVKEMQMKKTIPLVAVVVEVVEKVMEMRKKEKQRSLTVKVSFC